MENEKRYEVCERIVKFLDKNKVCCVSEVCPSCVLDTAIEVWIEWGDWKHEHLRMEWLLKDAGALPLGAQVTEEDGSDCYSAFHSFVVGEDFLKEVEE